MPTADLLTSLPAQHRIAREVQAASREPYGCRCGTGCQRQPARPGVAWKRQAWQDSLERLRAYVTENGYPHQTAVAEDGWRPGWWVSKYRQRWWELDRERQHALSSVPGFVRPCLSGREVLAERGPMMLVATLRAHDAGVDLVGDATFEGYPVGAWLSALHQGRVDLEDVGRAALAAAGVTWRPARGRGPDPARLTPRLRQWLVEREAASVVRDWAR